MCKYIKPTRWAPRKPVLNRDWGFGSPSCRWALHEHHEHQPEQVQHKVLAPRQTAPALELHARCRHTEEKRVHYIWRSISTASAALIGQLIILGLTRMIRCTLRIRFTQDDIWWETGIELELNYKVNARKYQVSRIRLLVHLACGPDVRNRTLTAYPVCRIVRSRRWRGSWGWRRSPRRPIQTLPRAPSRASRICATAAASTVRRPAPTLTELYSYTRVSGLAQCGYVWLYRYGYCYMDSELFESTSRRDGTCSARSQWSLLASNVCTKSGQSMNFKNNHEVSYSSHAHRIHIIHTNIYGY